MRRLMSHLPTTVDHTEHRMACILVPTPPNYTPPPKVVEKIAEAKQCTQKEYYCTLILFPDHEGYTLKKIWAKDEKC